MDVLTRGVFIAWLLCHACFRYQTIAWDDCHSCNGVCNWEGILYMAIQVKLCVVHSRMPACMRHAKEETKIFLLQI